MTAWRRVTACTAVLHSPIRTRHWRIHHSVFPVGHQGLDCFRGASRVARARLADYRARFAALDAAAQDEVLRRMLAAHAHRGRSTETVEALIWRADTCRDAPPGEPAERMAEAIGEEHRDGD